MLLLVAFREHELFDPVESQESRGINESFPNFWKTDDGKLRNAVLNNERASRQCESSDFHIKILEILISNLRCNRRFDAQFASKRGTPRVSKLVRVVTTSDC